MQAGHQRAGIALSFGPGGLEEPNLSVTEERLRSEAEGVSDTASKTKRLMPVSRDSGLQEPRCTLRAVKTSATEDRVAVRSTAWPTPVFVKHRGVRPILTVFYVKQRFYRISCKTAQSRIMRGFERFLPEMS